MENIKLTEDQKEILRFGYKYIFRSKGKSYSFFPMVLEEDLDSENYKLINLKDAPKEMLDEMIPDMIYGTGFSLK